MDDETWDRMVIATMDAISPKVEAKLDHDLVKAYRGTFWEIYKWTGADPMDYESCPPFGVLRPDIPILAFDEVKDLRNRYEELQASAGKLEQFAMWIINELEWRGNSEKIAVGMVVRKAREALGADDDG